MTDPALVIVALCLGVGAAALVVACVLLARVMEQVRANAEAMLRLAASCERVTGERITVPEPPGYLTPLAPGAWTGSADEELTDAAIQATSLRVAPWTVREREG